MPGVDPVSTGLEAGGKVADAIKEYIKKQPTESQKVLKEFFKLLRELKAETKKPKKLRNHAKILQLQETKDMFFETILKGVDLENPAGT